MQFFVRGDLTRGRRPEYPYVALDRDNWDDYGYKTTFMAVLHVTAGTKVDLGAVKIMRSDQESGSTTMPKSPFKELGMEHASLGSDLGYYENPIRSA